MADIDGFLTLLDKVKPNGEGKWVAICPAHNDKTPSLAIKAVDDKILLHCFGGCDVESITAAVGLSLVDLMPERPSYKKGVKPPRFNKYELFDRIFEESLILYIATKQMLNGHALSNEDQQRVNEALEVIFDIKREVTR